MNHSFQHTIQRNKKCNVSAITTEHLRLQEILLETSAALQFTVCSTIMSFMKKLRAD